MVDHVPSRSHSKDYPEIFVAFGTLLCHKADLKALQRFSGNHRWAMFQLSIIELHVLCDLMSITQATNILE